MFVIADDTADRNLIPLEFTCVLFWKPKRVLISVRRSLCWYDFMYQNGVIKKKYWYSFDRRIESGPRNNSINHLSVSEASHNLRCNASFSHCFPCQVYVYSHSDRVLVLFSCYRRHLHASNVVAITFVYATKLRVKSNLESNTEIGWASHYLANTWPEK